MNSTRQKKMKGELTMAVEETKVKSYFAKGIIGMGNTGDRTSILPGEAIPADTKPEMLAKWIKRGLVMTKEDVEKIAADKEAAEKKAKAALKR
jgi:hypothetical protein